MKKTMLAVAFLTLIVGSIFYEPEAVSTYTTDKTTGQVVEQAFNSSNADIEEVIAEAHSIISHDFKSRAQLEEIAEEIIILPAYESIKAWKQYESSREDTEMIELVGHTDKWDYSILLKSSTDQETKLVVRAETQDYVDDIAVIEYQLKEAFAQYDIFPQFNIYYQGRLSERLSGEQKESLTNQMFSAVAGYSKEGLSEDFLASYSGYTPKISTTVESGTKEINMQIAVRDHSNDEDTLVYVAYPVITKGY